jgi:hypothetical protein
VALRRVHAIETGCTLPTEQELRAIAVACGTSITALVPPGLHLTVAVHAGPPEATEPPTRNNELDARLYDYLATVLELRHTPSQRFLSIRQDDIVELAGALGMTPEAIEVRLRELVAALG